MLAERDGWLYGDENSYTKGEFDAVRVSCVS